MKKKIGFIVCLLVLFILVGCTQLDLKDRLTKDGIRLEIELDQNSKKMSGPVTASVHLTNRTNQLKVVSVFLPSPDREQIAMTTVNQDGFFGTLVGEALSGVRRWKGDQDNILIVELPPKTTYTQEFVWDGIVNDPLILDRTIEAPSGEYQITASVILDVLGSQTIESPDQLTVGKTINYEGTSSNSLTMEQLMKRIEREPEAWNWYQGRTYDTLVKKEGRRWYIKDSSGEWVSSNKELAEQLKEIKPRYIGGELHDSTKSFYFESQLGGTPHKMEVVLDSESNEVMEVLFWEH